jgi:hypothetical protein
MKPRAKTAIATLVLCTLGAVIPAAAAAQTAGPQQLPKGWTYQVDSHGNRVAKTSRVLKQDGSWREEIRQGNCLTVKERSATGEYKETTQCTGAKGS